jgi:hypothetical protein
MGALGIAAPELSVTRPEIEAVAACPNNEVAEARVQMQHMMAADRASPFQKRLIDLKTPFVFYCPKAPEDSFRVELITLA